MNTDTHRETLQQLGQYIMASLTKADNHTTTAGRRIIEAKSRIEAGESYPGGFRGFLATECPGLGKSRAYELIAIANGTTTVAQVRDRAAAGMKRLRATKAVRNVTDTWAMSPEDLEQRRQAALEHSAWIKQQPGYVPYVEPPEIELIYSISDACESVSEETLLEVLLFLRDSRLTPAALAEREALRDA